MLYKILGIILILLGITGAIIPVMPSIPFLIIGVLLLYKDKLHEIRKALPEEFPSLLAGMYCTFASKMFAPYHKKICDSITLSDGGILLDVGTGPGTLPIAIANKFPSVKVIGIDLSKKMIEIAEKNKEGARGKGIEKPGIQSHGCKGFGISGQFHRHGDKHRLNASLEKTGQGL